jgi:hypothetical protein
MVLVLVERCKTMPEQQLQKRGEDKMKRYTPHTLPCVTPDNYTEMREDPEGEWVRYEDVKKEFHKYAIEYSVCEDMIEELQNFLQGRRNSSSC